MIIHRTNIQSQSSNPYYIFHLKKKIAAHDQLPPHNIIRLVIRKYMTYIKVLDEYEVKTYNFTRTELERNNNESS